MFPSHSTRTSAELASASIPPIVPERFGHSRRKSTSPLAGTATHGPPTVTQFLTPLHGLAFSPEDESDVGGPAARPATHAAEATRATSAAETGNLTRPSGTTGPRAGSLEG